MEDGRLQWRTEEVRGSASTGPHPPWLASRSGGFPDRAPAFVSNMSLPRPSVLTALTAILCVGVAVVACTLTDYGVSWDEPMQSRYAEKVILYFQTFGADRSCNDLVFMKYNNTLVDLVAALIHGVYPAAKFEIRHAVSAALALLTVPALVRLGRRLGWEWAGVVGALFLLTTPPFYGHAFVNTKDIPFACFFAWTMDALAALVTRRTGRLREFLALGLAAGLTAAVRPGGLVMLAAIFVATIAHAAITRRSEWGLLRGWALLAKSFAALVVAWSVMVAPWPWAHENVLLNPVRAIRVASSFPNTFPFLFNGQRVWSNRLPWYYVVEFFLITTPLPMLVLACLGMLDGFRRVVREPRSPASAAAWVALLWTLLPVVAWTATRPNIYDGIRHFLFVFPALAFWAGQGGARLMSLPGRRAVRVAIAGGLVAAVVWPVHQIVRLHPYQLTYFNELVGGLRGAEGRFETEYWLTSYKEAVEWLNDRADRSGQTVGIYVATISEAVECARYYCGPHVRVRLANFYAPLTGPFPPDIDYFVSTTRFRHDENYPMARTVKTIGREGAVFTVIKAP